MRRQSQWIGATLEMETNEGAWFPISSQLDTWTKTKKKYSSIELELLAVVWTVDGYKN